MPAALDDCGSPLVEVDGIGPGLGVRLIGQLGFGAAFRRRHLGGTLCRWQNRPSYAVAVLAARRFGVTDQVVHGVHEYDDDPRNDAVLVYVSGELKPRAEAVVSVFDSGFVLGDGVWERLRVHAGHPMFLDQHLDRLYEGAKAIALDIGLSRHDLRRAIYQTLRANAMTDGVHVRLMVTRGLKRTPYQDPRMTVGPPTIVIVPEYKQPRRAILDTGIRLFTVHVRRPYPDVLDPKLNTPTASSTTSPPASRPTRRALTRR